MHRAIETRYAGRRFRSRLEARYAVLFDALGIIWDYEPEGFELGEGLRYLPDFFVRCLPGSGVCEKYPDAGYWVEIKPEAPSEMEKRKLALLANQTGHISYLFAGPVQRADVWYAYPGSDTVKGGPEIRESAPLNCCSPKFGQGWYQAWGIALTQALSARFEFGENGTGA